MKRIALEKAFVPVHASEMPIWQQNHDLMEWLKDLKHNLTEYNAELFLINDHTLKEKHIELRIISDYP